MQQEGEERVVYYAPAPVVHHAPVVHRPPAIKSEFPSLGLIVTAEPEVRLVLDKNHYAAIDETEALPLLEYTTVCNADFLPVICNEFVSDYLDKNQRTR